MRQALFQVSGYDRGVRRSGLCPHGACCLPSCPFLPSSVVFFSLCLTLIYALCNEPFEESGWVWGRGDGQGPDLALEEPTQP